MRHVNQSPDGSIVDLSYFSEYSISGCRSFNPNCVVCDFFFGGVLSVPILLEG